jgi:hypothetical protein
MFVPCSSRLMTVGTQLPARDQQPNEALKLSRRFAPRSLTPVRYTPLNWRVGLICLF